MEAEYPLHTSYRCMPLNLEDPFRYVGGGGGSGGFLIKIPFPGAGSEYVLVRIGR